MTREEYGKAYTQGYQLTVKLLIKRGIVLDLALDIAQTAWVKGWERLWQLRDEQKIFVWINSIAINTHRHYDREEPRWESLRDLPAPAKIDLRAIDLRRLMKSCRPTDLALLHKYYM